MQPQRSIVGMFGYPLDGNSDAWHLLLRDILTVIKGFRNGLVYGAKIRLPHAAVMTFLFRTEASLPDKLKIIAKLTKTHAWNLARFVAIYKSLMILLRRLNLNHESDWHPFAAGCIGGYWVFSRDNPVNNQIVLYLLARILTGLVKLSYQQCTKKLDNSWLSRNAFKIEATLVWGIVMWLFRRHRHTLQSSLQSSMQYLYNDSDTWSSVWTLLVHNK